MGMQAAKNIRARQRETAARVERLITQRDERAPIGSARRARIHTAIREVRHALRARNAAQAKARSAETAAGAALARIVAEGLCRRDAFEATGLPTSVGRRLIRSAEGSTPPVGSTSSTGQAPTSARVASAEDRETGTTTSGASTRGKL